MDNYVHDNNNPNVPQVGQAGSTPLGTGLSLSGARNDTVMHNRFVRNDAWGVLIQVQQGEGGKPCIGGQLNFSFLGVSLACLFDNWGNAVLNNKFADNGSYGHATNGDIGTLNFLDGNPTNCFSGNTDPAGLTTSPAGLEQTHPSVHRRALSPAELERAARLWSSCAATRGRWSGSGIPCPGGKPYPLRTHVVMHPLPKHLPTMPVPVRRACRPTRGARRLSPEEAELGRNRHVRGGTGVSPPLTCVSPALARPSPAGAPAGAGV